MNVKVYAVELNGYVVDDAVYATRKLAEEALKYYGEDDDVQIREYSLIGR